jgi:hypothetical protein
MPSWRWNRHYGVALCKALSILWRVQSGWKIEDQEQTNKTKRRTVKTILLPCGNMGVPCSRNQCKAFIRLRLESGGKIRVGNK